MTKRGSAKSRPQSDQAEQLQPLRHSLAHLLAAAVMELWPDTKRTIGPAIENGFYYDFEFTHPLSDSHLQEIEDKMRQILPTWDKFERQELSAAEAKAEYPGNQFKHELIDEFSEGGAKKVSFYQSGNFRDLCRGGHIDSMKQVDPQAFKLTKLAGAYWRGDAQNPQLTRIYGVAFATKRELDEYLAMMEEAEKRDHRVLGARLKLFFISETVGQGLPLLMPHGERVKKILMDYMRDKEEALGYQYVATPVLAQRELYERSGHAAYYLENMYTTSVDEEGNQFFIKPMNCPHHHMIYEKMVESYRDLPLRLSEHAGLYRYELSGTLTGLIRMRGPITQNDSHTYVTPDQLKAEFTNLLNLFDEVYRETGVHDYWFRLSLPDFEKTKYAGDRQQWEWAAGVIRESLDEVKADYVEETDEAAFYGPKLDVQIRNVLGKEDSIATIQIDILVPERMGLTYVDSEGNKQFPIVIHKSIMGAFERFMAFLLEQTAGNLPLWLAPEQVRVATVSDEPKILEVAGKFMKHLRSAGLRPYLDDSNESVGKKIRAAELMKVPFTVVLGEKELESGEVTPRIRADLASGAEVKPMKVDLFVETLAREVKSRTSKSTL